MSCSQARGIVRGVRRVGVSASSSYRYTSKSSTANTTVCKLSRHQRVAFHKVPQRAEVAAAATEAIQNAAPVVPPPEVPQKDARAGTTSTRRARLPPKEMHLKKFRHAAKKHQELIRMARGRDIMYREAREAITKANITQGLDNIRRNDLFYSIPHGVHLARSTAKGFFNETLSVAINCRLDTRKQDQVIRTTAQLPYSFKKVRVAVFAQGAKAEEAKAAGADLVGAEDLVDKVKSGKIEFDRAIATPDMMPIVGRVARILGPRGLMPNPKMGTITLNVSETIKTMKAGQITFRTEKGGVVHAAVGKLRQPPEEVVENVRALVDAVVAAKPSGAGKRLFKKAAISSTQGKGIPLDVYDWE